jgi:hypothetical protein
MKLLEEQRKLRHSGITPSIGSEFYHITFLINTLIETIAVDDTKDQPASTTDGKTSDQDSTL